MITIIPLTRLQKYWPKPIITAMIIGKITTEIFRMLGSLFHQFINYKKEPNPLIKKVLITGRTGFIEFHLKVLYV